MPILKFHCLEGYPKPATYDHILDLNSLSEEFLLLIESLALKHSYEPHRMKRASEALLVFIKNLQGKSFSLEEVKEDLEHLGVEKSRIALIAPMLQSSQKVQISDVKQINVHQLVDMEWKFGVTSSSSEFSAVGATFLQLKLTVLNSKDQLENIHLELSLSQFYNFLYELERAKLSLE